MVLHCTTWYCIVLHSTALYYIGTVALARRFQKIQHCPGQISNRMNTKQFSVLKMKNSKANEFFWPVWYIVVLKVLLPDFLNHALALGWAQASLVPAIDLELDTWVRVRVSGTSLCACNDYNILTVWWGGNVKCHSLAWWLCCY